MFGNNMMLVIFVDDCGLSVSDPTKIDWFVNELRKRGFELQVEGDFTAFLGVGIERLPDGRIHMSQTGLIKKILKATSMEDCNPNWSPAAQAALSSDPDGELYNNKKKTRKSIIYTA